MPTPQSRSRDLICIIDDDEDVRGSVGSLLRAEGFEALTFETPEAFLASADDCDCLILDVLLRNANGIAFLEELLASEATVPVIVITGHGDIPMTVRAMKAGAVNFLTKPFEDSGLIAAVKDAVERGRRGRAQAKARANLKTRFESLTPREHEVMGLVTAGLMNKQMAARLGVSEVTVKIHRSNVMRKMHAQSLADLVRMAEMLGARETSASRYARPG